MLPLSLIGVQILSKESKKIKLEESLGSERGQ